MSLLGSSGITGDIWSSGAFSFESPLKDLLDTNDYTTEQLLAEDELLQELRGVHPVLTEYFSSDAAVTQLVRYIILPPYGEGAGGQSGEEIKVNGETFIQIEQRVRRQLDRKKAIVKTKTPEEDPEMRRVRFPFMACEIICCEIDGIIDTLVQGRAVSSSTAGIVKTRAIMAGADHTEVEVIHSRPRRILDLLFSVLFETPPGQLDDYRAGYFDKILSILLRKKPQEMSSYINLGGVQGREVLMEVMMKHLYSHSIMQICQRLLLPPRPVLKQPETSAEDENGVGQGILAGEEDEVEGASFKCDWSESGLGIRLLLERLMHPETLLGKDADSFQLLSLSLNASEVLITIIQNSMLTSETMLFLTSMETMTELTNAATKLDETASFSPHESLLTSAMNVVESLILQLGGYGAVGTMSILEPTTEGDQNRTPSVDAETPQEGENAASGPVDAEIPTAQNNPDHLLADDSSLVQILPTMLDGFSKLLRHPSTSRPEWRSPIQFSKTEPVQLLGTSRLRIVRVIESLVLLGDPTIDSRLVQSDCLLICLDLFWEFQWCSMLHQSVANLLVHVFEGQNARYEIQEYFISNCNLIGRLMDSFVEITDPKVHHLGLGAKPVEGIELKEQSGGDKLVVSEDDVDAALEKQEEQANQSAEPKTDETQGVDNIDGASTEAMHDPSAFEVPPVAQSFRFGYMGHVIIICQALVQACAGNEWIQEQGDEVSDPSGEGAAQRQAEVAEITKAAENFFDPLMIADFVNNHELAERWQDFVVTTLAAEIAVQSTPLGGMNVQPFDPLQAHRPDVPTGRRPGLADDGDIGDGALAPPPPRGMLGGGDVIDMDDNDLEVAATMMAGLGLGRQNDESSDGSNSGSGDSGTTYSSGETAQEGYLFEDPLGKTGGTGSLGMVLGKLGQYNPDTDAPPSKIEDENDSSDEEPEANEVPVMDLFAGNFNHIPGQGSPGDEKPDSGGNNVFDFANFDDAFAAAEAATSLHAPTEADGAFPSEAKANIDDIFGASPTKLETILAGETEQEMESGASTDVAATEASGQSGSEVAGNVEDDEFGDFSGVDNTEGSAASSEVVSDTPPTNVSDSAAEAEKESSNVKVDVQESVQASNTTEGSNEELLKAEKPTDEANPNGGVLVSS